MFQHLRRLTDPIRHLFLDFSSDQDGLSNHLSRHKPCCSVRPLITFSLSTENTDDFSTWCDNTIISPCLHRAAQPSSNIHLWEQEGKLLLNSRGTLKFIDLLLELDFLDCDLCLDSHRHGPFMGLTRADWSLKTWRSAESWCKLQINLEIHYGTKQWLWVLSSITCTGSAMRKGCFKGHWPVRIGGLITADGTKLFSFLNVLR